MNPKIFLIYYFFSQDLVQRLVWRHKKLIRWRKQMIWSFKRSKSHRLTPKLMIFLYMGFLQQQFMLQLNKNLRPAVKLSILVALHKKWSFPLRISSVNVTKSAETADLVTFTEEMINGTLHFLCSVDWACPSGHFLL